MNLFLSPVHPNKHPQQSVQQPYIKKVEFKVEITPSLRTQYLGPSSKYFLPSVSLPLAFILSFFIDFVLQWLLGCFTIFGCLCSFPRIKSADSARYSREAVLTLGKKNRENSESWKIVFPCREKSTIQMNSNIFIKYRQGILGFWFLFIINIHLFSNIKITYWYISRDCAVILIGDMVLN